MRNGKLIEKITEAEAAIDAALVHFSRGIQQVTNATDNLFFALFDVIEEEPAPAPAPIAVAPKQVLSTVPLDDLMQGAIAIPYSGRTQNSVVAFMDFKAKHRRWLDQLIADVLTIGSKSATDAAIMDSASRARKDNRRTQTWYDFVFELHADKVVSGNDFTESQMFRLGELVALLSTGKTLNGCYPLTFRDRNTGNTF